MARNKAAWLIGLGACLIAPALLADDFSARLGRVPVDNRTQADIAGIGHADATLDGNELTVEGEFSGLLGPATVANLHLGVAVGARGPVIAPLTVEPGIAGKLSGTVRLDRSQVEALRAGRLYIQIHSERAPDGNLWGWLLADDPGDR